MCIDVHTYTQADTAKRQNWITFFIVYSKDGLVSQANQNIAWIFLHSDSN